MINQLINQCGSCKTNIANIKGSTKFKCPNCGKQEIIRCKRCRELSTKYECCCGFVGPN